MDDKAPTTNITLDLQIASNATNLPTEAQFMAWVNAAIAGRTYKTDLTIRIVDEAEGAELNLKYRNKQGATNVLSFPEDDALDPEFDFPLLGDIVICAPIVAKEAAANGKDLSAHWAHIVVHGTLHLLGFDHINKQEAIEMETLETALLLQFNYPPPYGDLTDHA